MYTCIHVYSTCICVYTCGTVLVRVTTSLASHPHVCMYVRMYMYVCTCMYYTYARMYVRMYVHVHVCMHICMYVQ